MQCFFIKDNDISVKKSLPSGASSATQFPAAGLKLLYFDISSPAFTGNNNSFYSSGQRSVRYNRARASLPTPQYYFLARIQPALQQCAEVPTPKLSEEYPHQQMMAAHMCTCFRSGSWVLISVIVSYRRLTPDTSASRGYNVVTFLRPAGSHIAGVQRGVHFAIVGISIWNVQTVHHARTAPPLRRRFLLHDPLRSVLKNPCTSAW